MAPVADNTMMVGGVDISRLDVVARAIVTFVASRIDGVQRSDIAEHLTRQNIYCAPVTIWRHLKAAVDSGLIEASGATSAARYSPSQQMRVQLLRKNAATPVSQRPKVGYQQEFLAEYEPNRSSYLSERQLSQLMNCCPPGSVRLSQVRQRDLTMLLAGLPWASSKLEGNAYDLASTRDLIMNGVIKEDTPPRDRTMILNHYDAISFIIKNLDRAPDEGGIGLNLGDLRQLHYMLSRDLMRQQSDEGCLRSRPVLIGESSYTPTSTVQVIESATLEILDKARRIENPYEAAFFLSVHIPYLQPFQDCNKRTSRVVCNIPLLRSHVMPMTWMDVNESDYLNGIISVYETCQPDLLSEVFVESYIRSMDRFEHMRCEIEPDPVSVQYRNEINAVIRNRVVNDDESIPATIRPQDLESFVRIVDSHINLLRKDGGARLAGHMITPEQHQAWLEREAQVNAQRAPVLGKSMASHGAHGASAPQSHSSLQDILFSAVPDGMRAFAAFGEGGHDDAELMRGAPHDGASDQPMDR